MPHFTPFIGWVGEKHPRWKGGKTTRRDGYVRITAGPDRNEYEHRVIIRAMLKHPISQNLTLACLDWMHIHHMDFNKSNNQDGNLLLLDPRLHMGFSHAWKPRSPNGRYQSAQTNGGSPHGC